MKPALVATAPPPTLARWTRRDPGQLATQVPLDDPGAYSKPFTTTYVATLEPGEELMEYICQENNQFGVAGGFN